MAHWGLSRQNKQTNKQHVTVRVTCTGHTCGLLELNSKITAVFVDEGDVTSRLFQPSDKKEGRESTMTEETQSSRDLRDDTFVNSSWVYTRRQ
jgi:hypothetical protein